jgi:protein-disulfide isomerase
MNEEPNVEMADSGAPATPVAATPAAASPKKDRILPVSILVAAVMVSGALVFATLYKGGGASNNANAGLANGETALAPSTGPSATTTAALLALTSRDAVLGSANAPVTVIEYGDYQCPFCAQYFATLQPQLIQQYINTGEVKMVFRNFPFLGTESTAAAEAAECAEDQNKLWAYHDALYNAKLGDDQAGGGEDDGFYTAALFTSLAGKVGMNTTTFANCVNGNTDANLVTQDKANATAVGVDSTPTTFVNGVMVTDSSGESVGDNQTAVLAAIASAVAAAK